MSLRSRLDRLEGRTPPNATGRPVWRYIETAPGVGVVRVGWRGKNDESKEVLELVDFRRLSPEELAEVREDALALEDRAYRISADVFGQTPRSETASP